MSNAVTTVLKVDDSKQTDGLKKAERSVQAHATKVESIFKRLRTKIAEGISFGGGFALGKGAVDGLVGAVGKLRGGLLESIQAAAEAERAQLRLEQALKATGNKTGFEAQQLKAMAEMLANTTGATEAQVKAGMALMATFTNIRGDTFKEAIVGALDLAAAKGKDLKEVINAIGTALDDPAKGMEALGEAVGKWSIQEETQFRRLIAQGRQLEVQQLMLAKLRGKFGGAAGADRQGIAGSINTIEKATQSLYATIGAAFGNQLAKVATTMERAAQFLKESDFAKTLGAAIDKWAGEGGIIGKMIDMAAPIATAVAGFADKIVNFAGGIKSTFDVIVASIKETMYGWLEELIKAFEALLSRLPFYKKGQGDAAAPLGARRQEAKAEWEAAVKAQQSAGQSNMAGFVQKWADVIKKIASPNGGKDFEKGSIQWLLWQALGVGATPQRKGDIKAKGVADPFDFSRMPFNPKFEGLTEHWRTRELGARSTSETAMDKIAKNTKEAWEENKRQTALQREQLLEARKKQWARAK